MTDIIIKDCVWITGEEDKAVDDALAGMSADIQRNAVYAGPATADELVGKLAWLLARCPPAEFAATLAEWRKRRAAGYRAPVPELRPGRPAILTRPEARRTNRIGYGVSKAQAGR